MTSAPKSVPTPTQPTPPESTQTKDGEVLRLRSTGQSFARISRDLGLDRPLDAQRAFQRAIRRLPAEERSKVAEQESSRLDRLQARVNADTERPAEDRTRRLAAIERLRASLASAQA
jgi:acyl-CoA reductase-like NAD-dependent aldehyde dehydrogenase